MILGNFSLPEPLLVWGLFLRCLGLVYFIAIIQLYWQVLPLAGSNGISPVRYKLGQIKRDYVPIKRWLLFPTLLWVNASDRFLKILVITGSVSSLLVMPLRRAFETELVVVGKKTTEEENLGVIK